MKKYLLLTLSLAFVAIASLGFAQAIKKNDAIQTAATQPQTISMREAMNRDKLAALLSPVGVSVAEASLRHSRVDSSREILLRWDASAEGRAQGSAVTTQEPAARTLSVLNSKTRNQGLSLQRAFELSPTQVLVVAVSEAGQLRWWSLMPDPRILRAETSDDAGNLSGQTLYHSKADFIVAVPDDQTITEVRLYHPRWNGTEFSLEPVGAIRLP
jgi:hypothetical protein